MPDYSIKHDLVRAQTEARLAPMKRLRDRQALLLGLFPVYLLLMGIVMASRSNNANILLAPLFVIFSALYFIQIVHFSLDFHHERVVQRETEKAMEFERLRLLHALSTAEDSAPAQEKAKRTLALSDDGELVSEDAEESEALTRQSHLR